MQHLDAQSQNLGKCGELIDSSHYNEHSKLCIMLGSQHYQGKPVKTIKMPTWKTQESARQGQLKKSQPQIKHEQLQRSQQETCALEGLGCLGVFHSLSSWWRRHNDVMSIPQVLSSFHFCEWNACNVLYIYTYVCLTMFRPSRLLGFLSGSMSAHFFLHP